MSSESENNEAGQDEREPKIIVDTDWKEQVAREKESAAEPGQEKPDASPEQPAKHSGSQGGREEESPNPPPASFDVLVSMLFTQAMATLGQMPDPSTGKTKVSKPLAKHYIDTLDMLDEKTKGNLSDDESRMLSEALHALRMMFVNVRE